MNLFQAAKDIVSGYANYMQDTYGKGLPPYMTEQIEWRMYRCSPCLQAGFCKHCNCKTPVLFYSATKTDALKRWGPMLPEDEWNAFKLTKLYQDYIHKAPKDDTIWEGPTGSGYEGDSRPIEQPQDFKVSAVIRPKD